MTFKNPYLFLLALSTTWSSIDCRPNINQRPICQTEACKKSAQVILNSMDKTTDPCDDFYQYACGGFISKNQIPENKEEISLTDDIQDLMFSQIRKLPKESIDPTDSESVRKLKNFYMACMDTEAIEELGISEVLKDFQELGGWPVVEGDAWKEEEFDWVQMIFKMEELGYNSEYFFSMFVQQNITDMMRYQLYIAQPKLDVFSTVDETSGHIVKAYSSYVMDMAKLFGAKEERVNEELEEVVRFEIQLAKIFSPEENEANMSFREVNEKFSYFPWLDYVNYRSGSNNLLNGSDIVKVIAPEYLEKFGQLSSKTSKRLLANFLFTKTVLDIVDYLPKDFLKRRDIFLTETDTKTITPPLNETCFMNVFGRFLFIINNLYIKKYFNKDTKKVATVMVNELFESASQTIKNTTWMDKKTRENALTKLEAMLKTVAYPDEILDDEKIDEYYKDIVVNKKKYLMSSLNVNKFTRKIEYRKLKTPFPKGDWRNTDIITVVNAFYRQEDNSITIPAGILQGVYFDVGRPQYMNFGGIGVVIGHEITHGFDNEGSEYDKDGKRVNWWTPQVLEAFKNKSQCMIEQYSNVTVPEIGKHLNGNQCLGENIADNGGIKKAYVAYNEWKRKHGEEPLLPGIDLNTKQLFWVSNANVWCNKQSKIALEQQIDANSHSPGKYRINIPFGNSEDFIRDFQCKEGTKMNPYRKCSVW